MTIWIKTIQDIIDYGNTKIVFNDITNKYYIQDYCTIPNWIAEKFIDDQTLLPTENKNVFMLGSNGFKQLIKYHKDELNKYLWEELPNEG